MKRPSPLPPRSAPLRSREPACGGGIKRKKRIKKANRERKARAFARAYGSVERVEWIKGFRCVISRVYQHIPAVHEGPIDCAHAKGGGAGRKGNAETTVPLCRGHHVCLHKVGVATFERAYGVNLMELAAEYEAAWQSHLRQTGRARSEETDHV